ncbi:LysR family transcriptional regulator [Pseudomonas putida]|uniref:LysR family transcriptional regulator n=1 Tax=Pseudomonas putida TaxID=303 RepID=A0A7W2L406_PSEPU|nr:MULTISPECIES: LysR family transcriptional regulator [Pseudomonas]MBA6118040.1 LysR family transcriptional regulator [Pseudomonas putida]MBI6943807.1 LysR family transcriptional regulator [Pseudomonas putida]MBI6959893.1 LysR family transcriptional regulator [Pseudomonas putida]MCZ9637686.1 LysR family transcriptional regulator [Pseudomonas putida]MEC4876685.1 LysR family transcriptional regulator [Pseudomonas sp. NC26]|eukprot:TRINITY_DN18170_c0_g1_i1.p1 TRINITY_DN18170_c0_g1~~TRINITY_DN18170_c0_g1_i1.p1  ORF type:complete len:112 (-),score=6.13 TRINITY_DN18170_c0_g1_i1:102-437(-)
MKTQFFKVVQTVAQHGSFSEAAAILGCSQSNISYAIKEVEDHFEQRLFIRSRTGCVLTPEGKIIAQSLSVMLATLAQLKKRSQRLCEHLLQRPYAGNQFEAGHGVSGPAIP